MSEIIQVNVRMFFFIFPKSKNDQVRAIFVVHICQIWGSDGILAASHLLILLWFLAATLAYWLAFWMPGCLTGIMAATLWFLQPLLWFLAATLAKWLASWMPGCRTVWRSVTYLENYPLWHIFHFRIPICYYRAVARSYKSKEEVICSYTLLKQGYYCTLWLLISSI